MQPLGDNESCVTLHSSAGRVWPSYSAQRRATELVTTMTSLDDVHLHPGLGRPRRASETHGVPVHAVSSELARATLVQTPGDVTILRKEHIRNEEGVRRSTWTHELAVLFICGMASVSSLCTAPEDGEHKKTESSLARSAIHDL